jgi:hypothetical protein
VWPNGEIPLVSNSEIVRVTGISGDTLTITREQEGSIAKSIAVGYQIMAAITAKVLTDIEEAIPPGTLLGVQVFTVSGTYTPTPGTTKVYVECVGGGGAGGGVPGVASGNQLGGGGGGGAYGASLLTSGFSGASYVVGAAGAGSSGAGGNGGTTSFGTGPLVSAGGGGGGAAGVTTGDVAAGAGGAAGVGQLTRAGQTGKNGTAASNINASSAGGAAALGWGGMTHSPYGNNAGQPGEGFGGAGSGAYCASTAVARNGGAGAQGVIRIWEFA